MEIKLTQSKLQEMLEKLLMKDMFPSSILTVKDEKVFSIQREEHGRAYRYIEFKKSFFDFVGKESDVFEIDVEKTLNIIKEYPANSGMVIEIKGDKVTIKHQITDEKGNVSDKGILLKSYKKPEGKILEKLPFDFKDGVPVLGEQKLLLNISFTINLEDLKSIANLGGKVETETYKFLFENGKILVRIGDLHSFSDCQVYYPEGKILDGTELYTIFTYGIPQVASTFRNKEVAFHTRTNSPIWIYEETEKYSLGIFIPPYIESS